MYIVFKLKGAKYVTEPNVKYSAEDVNVSDPNVQENDANKVHTSNNVQNDTNSVTEERRGNIRSFENPQAVTADEDLPADLSLSTEGSFPA